MTRERYRLLCLVMLILLIGCSPAVVFDHPFIEADCYFNRACLPSEVE
jgi:hypothetical protein